MSQISQNELINIVAKYIIQICLTEENKLVKCRSISPDEVTSVYGYVNMSMCIFICLCVYTYIYIYIYIYTCLYIYIQTCLYLYIEPLLFIHTKTIN